MRSLLVPFSLAMGLAHSAASSALAQTTTGTISGTVRDQSGGVMPGVTITALNRDTGLQRVTTTADNGLYRISALPFGSYDLTAELSGFTTVTARVDVAVDQVRTVNLTMPIATAQETVSVSGVAPLVRAEASKLGEVIDNTNVLGLPLNGRNFAQLTHLTPGVAVSGGGGGQQGGEGGVSGFSSNGMRSSSNNFMVDGIDANNYLAGSAALLPSIDSIQEFEVQTNTFAAEYGRNSGSVVNLITRSGTNAFHGSAFEFLRDDALDARNFFDDPSLPKPNLSLNQFGGTFGGPIKTDRVFFFASYEGFRRSAGVTKVTNVPTLEERQGIFTNANGNKVRVNVHPASAALFDLFPKPNTDQPSGNFLSSPELADNRDQLLLKGNFQFQNDDSILVRYNFSRTDSLFPFTPGQGGTTIPGFGVISDTTDHYLTFNYVKILGDKALNEFRFGYNDTSSQTINEPGPRAVDFGFNTGHPEDAPRNLGNIPNITFSGGLVSGGGQLSNLGGTINNPSGADQRTFQFIDHFSYTTARHNWKFGFDIRHSQADRIFDLAFSGQIIFSGSQNSLGIPNPLIDFAEGRPSASLQFVGASSFRELRTTTYSFFAQDSFRVSDRLILNYGLRYDYQSPLRDAGQRLSTWRPERFETYLPPDADQTDVETLRRSGVVLESEIDHVYNPDRNNFAPRIGMSYWLTGDGKTVLRAAYGIYYDTVQGGIPGNVMLNPPGLPANFVPAPFVGYPEAFGPAAFPVLTITTEDFPSPFAHHFNVDFQKEIPWNMAFEIGYVGTRGRNLPRFRQINQAFITQEEIDQLDPHVDERLRSMGIPDFIIPFLLSRIDLIPPIARNTYFGFAQLFTAEANVESRYNSLQLKLNKRYSDGLSFLAAYTLSKSVDTASVFFGSGANGTTIFPQDNFNSVDGERGPSDFDIRHRFVTSFVYRFPAISGLPSALGDGWQVGGIVTLQSGQPFSVLMGTDNSSVGLGNDRPNLVGDPNDGPHAVDEWFNTGAFVPNELLTFGKSGRNIVRGPDYKNFDLVVAKHTPLSSRVSLEIRLEFFNFFNTAHFALPNNVFTAPNFGALFQTLDVAQNNVGLGSGGPRIIQIGARVTF